MVGEKKLNLTRQDGDKQTQGAATPYVAPEKQPNQQTVAVNTNTKASKYKGLPGVSSNTAAHVGQYQQGYTPSDAVANAEAYLNAVLGNKPSDYASNYTNDMNTLMDQIMNRGPFKYNLNEDMLYQQAKDQYMMMGQQAMMDTMAQASAMTGGYGSSYASTAGNQSYQQYLTALNNMVPEFYDRAYAQFEREGEDLYKQYGMLQDAENRDYSRWQDSVQNWQNDRDFALGQYDMYYGQDYSQYSDNRDYWTGLAAQENSNYWNERDQAYNTAMAMIEDGKMPSKDLLAAAGISQADAKKWLKKDPAPATRTTSNTSNTKKTTSPVVKALEDFRAFIQQYIAI